MVLRQRWFVQVLSILECLLEFMEGKLKDKNFDWIGSMIVCSEIVPLLNPDHVCDLIIQAIRQNQYRLLIPKSLNINFAIGRFENENHLLPIHRHSFSSY